MPKFNFDRSREDVIRDTEELNVYELISKDDEAIMDELGLKDDDRILTKLIITNLERQIAATVKDGLCASIPNIGNVEQTIGSRVVQENYHELKVAYHTLPREEYKNYRLNLMREYRKEREHKKEVERKCEYFKKKFFKHWVKIKEHSGEAAANLWLNYAHGTPIPFDPEVEAQWQEYYYGKTE